MRHAAAALVFTLLLPGIGRAQDGGALENRLIQSGADRVAFHFEVSDDVTVCTRGFRRGSEETTTVRWSGSDRDHRCEGGPLEVVVHREAGRVLDVELGTVGSYSSDVDLGAVDSGLAARWLMSLSSRDASTDASERALAGATVARDANPAPRLLDVARDRAVHREVRSAALFWVSQIAADGIEASLADIAADEGDDQEVRDAAVFALSRRPDGEAVPALMDLARTAPHLGTRRSALFWLAQSEDERVPDFFAELIHGSGG